MQAETMDEALRTFSDLLWSNLGLVTVGLFLLILLVELVSEPVVDDLENSPDRVLTNYGLMLVSAGIALIVPVSAVVAAGWAERNGIGVFNWVESPWWLVLPGSLVARTFFQYWLHRAMHEVPFLWRFHRVHHADTCVDATLAFRQHPLNLVPDLIVGVSLICLLGIPVWAIIIVDLFLVGFDFWQHANARLPSGVERRLRGVIATPEFHRYHHSANRRQTDSNYGSCIVLWDRAFRTFTMPGSAPIARIGLGEAYDEHACDLRRQFLLPFAAIKAEEIGALARADDAEAQSPRGG